MYNLMRKAKKKCLLINFEQTEREREKEKSIWIWDLAKGILYNLFSLCHLFSINKFFNL